MHVGGYICRDVARSALDCRCRASADNTVRLWDGRLGSLLHTLRQHTSPVQAVAFLPNGEVVVSGSSDTFVYFWSTRVRGRTWITRPTPAIFASVLLGSTTPVTQCCSSHGLVCGVMSWCGLWFCLAWLPTPVPQCCSPHGVGRGLMSWCGLGFGLSWSDRTGRYCGSLRRRTRCWTCRCPVTDTGPRAPQGIASLLWTRRDEQRRRPCRVVPAHEMATRQQCSALCCGRVPAVCGPCT